jgi:hypothetical protein
MKYGDNFTFFTLETSKTPSRPVINIVTRPTLKEVNSFRLRLLYPPQIKALIHIGGEGVERLPEPL